MTILSISIPTYNRATYLKELVLSILAFESDEIEVVVTNNCSTDNTLSILESIKDSRLKVYTNDKSVPGYYNMILGLFNASGKYVLHCNDRDLLCIKRLPNLISILKKESYSFIKTTRSYYEPSGNLIEFNKGFDSYIHQPHSSHPTGMVFNRVIMGKMLQKENYEKYVKDTFTYCFVMRDLMKYEKSAQFDCGIWDECHSSLKTKLSSGSIYKGNLYFEPNIITGFMASVIEYYLSQDRTDINKEQRDCLIYNIFDYFKNQLIYKKICYADKRECSHYGLKQKFVSYFTMKSIYTNYIAACAEVLKKYNYMTDNNVRWLRTKNKYMNDLFRDCLKADYSILRKVIKRLTDSKYPY